MKEEKAEIAERELVLVLGNMDLLNTMVEDDDRELMKVFRQRIEKVINTLRGDVS
jgi:hypothetical protein